MSEEQETPMTLDECAHCVKQLNIDLQRQTEAFRYFKQSAVRVASAARGAKVPERLPFITFNIPTSDGKPTDYKLDLNTASPDHLEAIAPVFDAVVDNVGDNLLLAWTRLIKILEIAAPQVQQALNSASEDARG